MLDPSGPYAWILQLLMSMRGVSNLTKFIMNLLNSWVKAPVHMRASMSKFIATRMRKSKASETYSSTCLQF
jgi:hypothetical protein